MPTPLLVAFDLDDTLAPSKAPIDPRVAALLVALAERVEVAIISGGQWQQFQDQVVARMGSTDAAVLDRFHLMPTCGTQYYRYAVDDATFTAVYAEYLDADVKARAFTVLEAQARRLGLWEESPAGNVIEDRGSQITFSALGQQAALDAKHAWDPSGTKRALLRDAVAPLLPDLEVRSGGSTSLDLTRVGIDKSYGMQRLADATGVDYADMLFYGDRLDEGGNDYPVRAMGVPSVAVTGWEDTVSRLTVLVPSLAARR